MKKIVFLLGTVAFLASCNKDETVAVKKSNSTPEYVTEGTVTVVNEYFTIGKGKANSQTYLLRAIAEAPIVNGVPTNCTSVIVDGTTGSGTGTGNIYATWHTVNEDHGGAISGYDYDFSNTDETIIGFTGEVRFATVDMHDAKLNGAGDRIYYAGQRDANDGRYPDSVLSPTIAPASTLAAGRHAGAVAGYVTLDGSGDIAVSYAWDETYLDGFGANGIAQFDNGTEYFEVVTGDEIGSVVRLEADLDIAYNSYDDASDNYADGKYVASNSTAIAVFHGEKLNPNTSSSGGATLTAYLQSSDFTGSTVEVDLSSYISNTIDLERNAIEWYSDDVLIADGDGITFVEDLFGSVSVSSFVSTIGGESRGIAVDEDNKLVYLGNGENGLMVIVAPDSTGGTAAGTVMGNYNRNYTIDAKDVFTDGNNELVFIADANGNLYIIEKV